MKFKLIVPLLAILTIFIAHAVMAAGTEDTADGALVTIHHAHNKQTGNSVISRIIPEISLNAANFAGYQPRGYSDGYQSSVYTSSVYNSKFGFGIGALVDFGQNGFVFESGLMYRQMGASLFFFDGDGTYNFNYLSIPVVAKYYFGEAASAVYLKAGLLPSFLVAHTQGAPGGRSYDFPNINSFDLQAVVAVGGRIYLSDSTDLIIEANSSRGFLKPIPDYDYYNTDFGFLTGVGINL